MSYKISPIELKFLLHCYYSPEPYPDNLPLLKTFRNEMIANGILIPSIEGEEVYNVTEKGKAWVEMILSVPFPVQKWVPGENY